MKGTQLAVLGGTPAIRSPLERVNVFPPRLKEEIWTLLESGKLSSLFGEGYVEQFEAAFAERIGVAYAVSMNSCTSCLHASLIALDIGPGDEVIVPAFSFVASASVIVQVGATPVFADIDSQTLCIDLQDLEKKITCSTKAVIGVHIFGTPACPAALAKLCDKYSIYLVEDCAQALGAAEDGLNVGSFGKAGCFSFNVNKIIQTGEGGIVCTNDERLYETLKMLRVNGITPFGVEGLGYNYTMTNLQALIGMRQLPELSNILEKRKRYCKILSSHVDEYVEVRDPSMAGNIDSYYSFSFFVPTCAPHARSALVVALLEEGVPVSGLYDLLYKYPFMSGYRPQGGWNCETAEDRISRMISLNPSHAYSEASIHEIGKGLRKVVSEIDYLITDADRIADCGGQRTF